MTPEEIRIVRDSYALAAPRGWEAAALFFGRLFALAPELKGVFAHDLPGQASRAAAAAGYLVAVLDRPEDLTPFVEELAALAALQPGFGGEHYARAGEALLWTLRQVLDGACTREVSAAWAKAYGLVAGAMIAAPSVDAIAA